LFHLSPTIFGVSPPLPARLFSFFLFPQHAIAGAARHVGFHLHRILAYHRLLKSSRDLIFRTQALDPAVTEVLECHKSTDRTTMAPIVAAARAALGGRRCCYRLVATTTGASPLFYSSPLQQQRGITPPQQQQQWRTAYNSASVSTPVAVPAAAANATQHPDAYNKTPEELRLMSRTLDESIVRVLFLLLEKELFSRVFLLLFYAIQQFDNNNYYTMCTVRFGQTPEQRPRIGASMAGH
jgi:hypothetical protein